jgi:hypothetical protein
MPLLFVFGVLSAADVKRVGWRDAYPKRIAGLHPPARICHLRPLVSCRGAR